MRTLALAGLLAVALVSAACGGSQKETRSAASTSSTTSARTDVAPEPKGDTAKSTLKRSAAKATVQQGLGAFLQKVTVDERPVFLGGKFHGWRITALKGDLSGIELRPGDVVTRVNGLPIERPEQALEAFRSVEVSSEIRIDYEREGEPRALRYAIVED